MFAHVCRYCSYRPRVSISTVQAIQHTSVTHAMLFSSSTPLLISIGALVLRRPISTGSSSYADQHTVSAYISIHESQSLAICFTNMSSRPVLPSQLPFQQICCSQVLSVSTCCVNRKHCMRGAGEIMGTGLGMVGVVLLTRASKVDQQVHTSLLSLLLPCYLLYIPLLTCSGVIHTQLVRLDIGICHSNNNHPPTRHDQ